MFCDALYGVCADVDERDVGTVKRFVIARVKTQAFATNDLLGKEFLRGLRVFDNGVDLFANKLRNGFVCIMVEQEVVVRGKKCKATFFPATLKLLTAFSL